MTALSKTVSHRLLLAVVVVLVVSVVSPPRSALACSYGGDVLSLDELAREADYVFEGIVTEAIMEGGSPYPTSGIVIPLVYFKADQSLPEKLLVSGYGNGSGDCRNAIHVGQQAIFLVDRDEQGNYIAHYHHPDSAIAFNRAENFVLLTHATGRIPVIVPLSDELDDEAYDARSEDSFSYHQRVSLTTEIEQLKQSISILRDKLTESNQLYSENLVTLRNTRGELRAAEDALVESEHERTRLQGEIARLQAENDELTQHINEVDHQPAKPPSSIPVLVAVVGGLFIMILIQAGILVIMRREHI